VDLYMVTSAQWGVAKLIRTGSADFSTAAVTHWHRRSDGGLVERNRLHPPARSAEQVRCHALRSGRQIPLAAPRETPTEASAFEALGVAYVPPEDRRDAHAFHVASTRWTPGAAA
ncbi:MAG: hypothetical protein AAFX50_12940, partial [Acidobacteriota bacterium]